MLSSGSVVVVPNGVWCAAIPESFVDTVTLYLQRDYLAGQLRWLPLTHPLLHRIGAAISGECAPSIMDIGEANLHGLRSRLSVLAGQVDHSLSGFSVLANLAHLFHEIDALPRRLDLSKAPHAQVPHPQVRAVVHALTARLDRPWTVGELARIAVLSESQVTRLFRKELGITPAAFLWRTRAERMAELLLAEGLTVGEAAREVGWADQSIASRAFRRRYGMSPREFSVTHTFTQPANTLSDDDGTINVNEQDRIVSGGQSGPVLHNQE